MIRFFLLALLSLCGQLHAKDIYMSTSFHEPATDGLRFLYSNDGAHWDSIPGTFLSPMVGKQRVMRDPSIVRGPDGTFHLVWTSSWRGDIGFGYSHSRDLIHWSEQQFISTGMDTATVNTWAPELFYDDVKRQYLIVWASCVPGRFPDMLEDHDNNHRLYYMTTRDFHKFSKARLFYDPGFSVIDATILKRGKGDYVMLAKDNSRNARNIKVAFAKTPYGPWSAASESFTDMFCEGPTAAKVGDWYYIFYDRYRDKTYGSHRTKDFKTFYDQAADVQFPVGHKHGTVFMAGGEIVEELMKYNLDCVRYTGKTMARPAQHDGGLAPVVGVHNIQVMRGGKPWTYNHQPMMAFWNGKFYVHYTTSPRHEHEAPGKTMLVTSADGYRWSKPMELFPEYPVPEGYTKTGSAFPAAQGLKAVMHQRVGWYVANNRLLATGNYGICLTMKDDPNDGNGIGRVVREVKADGTFGPIYFIYYNHGFNEKNTLYPYYKRARDRQFVKAVDSMLANPMQRMQWVEEADRNDDLIPMKSPLKAFCGYTLPDGRKVALWKHSLTSLSTDGGNTWRQPVFRAPGFVNANAKIWGQRLTDGTYATVYNPAEYRWPLAISLSSDGLEYTTLSLLNGEVTPERHGGQYKSYGPQYVRGIQEGNGTPDDNDLWLTYSNNKEDIWVARVNVPVRLKASSHADGSFGETISDMTDWNIYAPQLCPVTLSNNVLTLSDSDPYDYAKAERVIPATKELKVEFDVVAAQNDHGTLNVEFVDDHGNVANRLLIDSTAAIRVKGGARYGTLLKHYDVDNTYHICALISQPMHRSVFYVNGNKVADRQFDTPVDAITRIVFRTGVLFTEPNIETQPDQTFDLPYADSVAQKASYTLSNVVTHPLADGAFPLRHTDRMPHDVVTNAGAILDYADYAHYATRFNDMEEEGIATLIPNAEASAWMAKNVPLFDCPDEAMQEIYYFRWWSLRKHIIQTPVGWGMTEFLVQRSYADRYNLISCALGHHLMESRWLRDSTYLHGILRSWYTGNEGKAMAKMNSFSSWAPAAAYEAWKVLGDTATMMGLLPAFGEQYGYWKTTHRLDCGLYWQEDVKDGMEESISGGRKKRYARPTINSYMYGNAKAMAAFSRLVGDTLSAAAYDADASEVKRLVEERLWNRSHHFFETLRDDTLAAVREAIGYIPWYFDMPGKNGFDEAWLQVTDEHGFSAPYGLTTAERRHPQFRSRGVGTCEWDGAVWPFATSQTLTAMANYLNNYPNAIVGDTVFYAQMKRYVESQHHRGRPYIGEYLDESNGAWLMGDRLRSRYYNHSTFADLVITGLVGLRPQTDGSVVVNPLVPPKKWNYFCLDGINYRGHVVTVVWDADGQRYHQGTGLNLLVDGKRVVNKKKLEKIVYKP